MATLTSVNRRHNVFLSHSTTANAKSARLIQRALERIGRRWYQRRALDVYLDRTDLDVSPHLWPSILEDLEHSEYLVMLASPRAAVSAGVRKEVSHWLRTRGHENLLIVLIGGEIVWDDSGSRFLVSATTALPPELLECFQVEPKWADVRTSIGSPKISWRTPELHDELAGLASTIHRKPKRDLLRQERNAARLTKAALIGLAICCAVLLTMIGQNLYSHSSLYQIRQILSAPIEGPLADSKELAERRRQVPVPTIAAAMQYFAALAVLEDDREVNARIARINYPAVQRFVLLRVAAVYERLGKPNIAASFKQEANRVPAAGGAAPERTPSPIGKATDEDDLQEALASPDDLSKVQALAAIAHAGSAVRGRAAQLARTLIDSSKDNAFKCQGLSAWISQVGQTDAFGSLTEACASAVREHTASRKDVCMRLTTLGEALMVAHKREEAAPILLQAAVASKFLHNSYYRGYCSARAATLLLRIHRTQEASQAISISLAHAAGVTDGVSLSRLRIFLVEPLARLGRYEEARNVAELCNPEDRLQAYATIMTQYISVKYPNLGLDAHSDDADHTFRFDGDHDSE